MCAKILLKRNDFSLYKKKIEKIKYIDKTIEQYIRENGTSYDNRDYPYVLCARVFVSC